MLQALCQASRQPRPAGRQLAARPWSLTKPTSLACLGRVLAKRLVHHVVLIILTQACTTSPPAMGAPQQWCACVCCESRSDFS